MKKKLLILGMVMALFVVTVVPMTVSAATPTLGGENSSIGIGKPQAVWKITTVDSIGDVGRQPSLALNSSGDAEIAYDDFTNANVKLASWNGSTWQLETVAPGGRGNSLVIDKNGDADISTVQPHGYNLRYCHWNGSSWDTEIVVPGGGIMLGTSLALNSLGYPSISYTKITTSDLGLRFAQCNGSSWQISAVYNGYVGWYSSLAFNSQNRPCISFSTNDGYLEYAYYDGSAWHVENIDAIGFGSVGIDIAMKLDKCGNPHIIYDSYSAAGTKSELKYASWNGKAWTIQVVNNSSEIIIAPSLELDQQQNPHISYVDGTTGLVEYSVLRGEKWQTEIVDNVGPGYTVFTSLVLDKSGNPHITYFDPTNTDLKYAEKLLR